MSAHAAKQMLRTIKTTALKYTDIEIKVRDATSDSATDYPSTTLLGEIAQATYDDERYKKLVAMVWKRVNDEKKYLHVQKGLSLVEYLLRNGNKIFIVDCMARAHDIKRLEHYVSLHSGTGEDLGRAAAEKAKRVYELLMDEKKLAEEREIASKISGIKNDGFSAHSYMYASGQYAASLQKSNQYAGPTSRSLNNGADPFSDAPADHDRSDDADKDKKKKKKKKTKDEENDPFGDHDDPFADASESKEKKKKDKRDVDEDDPFGASENKEKKKKERRDSGEPEKEKKSKHKKKERDLTENGAPGGPSFGFEDHFAASASSHSSSDPFESTTFSSFIADPFTPAVSKSAASDPLSAFASSSEAPKPQRQASGGDWMGAFASGLSLAEQPQSKQKDPQPQMPAQQPKLDSKPDPFLDLLSSSNVLQQPQFRTQPQQFPFQQQQFPFQQQQQQAPFFQVQQAQLYQQQRMQQQAAASYVPANPAANPLDIFLGKSHDSGQTQQQQQRPQQQQSQAGAGKAPAYNANSDAFQGLVGFQR